MGDPIKTLVSRFVSLPYLVRMEVAGRLLRWRDEAQNLEKAEAPGLALNGQRRKSFMEQFWDEVEKTHNDGLYPRNPFTEKKFRFGF
ncbi:MAG: hypothetical protein QOH63_1359 [Acidobacteriota bacterium]|jgi:hypothetical protein|nr:hypothetical protein [Acidobacteriota bacterium]